jgi:hypothetical protein
LRLRLATALALGLPALAIAQPTPAPGPTPPPADPAPAEPPPPAETPAPDPATPPPAPAAPTDPTPPAPTPEPAKRRIGDFMDTRLSFTCTHEDMLRDPKVLPSAPGFHCGRPNPIGILFFDNYDTRYSGFETLSHLALYNHYNTDHWDLEAGFIVRVNEFSEENIRLSDGGSYIRAAYWLDPKRESKTRVAVTAFPVSSDRMRLGYSYRISWGGSAEFFKPNPDIPGSSGKNAEQVPGFKIQVDTEKAYAYVALKSTLLLDPTINEKRGTLAGLAGAGIDLNDNVRIEANGGVFDRGKNETEDVLGEPVILYGASAQVAVHDGMPVGSSVDYALYRNDPEAIARLFKKEEYPGGLSWLVSSEATTIFQTLKDPSATGSTRTQFGFAADLNARVKWNFFRFRADLMVRDLAFILHSVPSLPTYTDFLDEYDTRPELFAAFGVDRYFPGPQVTAGLTVGFDAPATIKTPLASDIPGNQTTSNTLVVRNESYRSVLPEGEDPALTWAIKGSVRVDIGPGFAALADLYFQYDPNTVRYERTSSEGTFQRAEFARFEQLGFNLTLQTRF